MSVFDLLSPLFRQKFKIFLCFLLFFGILFGLSQMLNNTHKTTIFFSVKATSSPSFNSHYQAAEGSERVAEMISGWVKNPVFRENILKESGASIPDFRKKISATKQNKMNVFVTLKLSENDQKYQKQVATAVYNQFQTYINDFNEGNAVTYGFSKPNISSQVKVFPLSWLIVGSLLFAFGLSIIFVYMVELLRNKVSFVHQVHGLFPESKILYVLQAPGKHDKKLVKHFLKQWKHPKIVGTYPQAKKHFQLHDSEKLHVTKDKPVLVVRLGVTTCYNLENEKALLTDMAPGIILFTS